MYIVRCGALCSGILASVMSSNTEIGKDVRRDPGLRSTQESCEEFMASNRGPAEILVSS